MQKELVFEEVMEFAQHHCDREYLEKIFRSKATDWNRKDWQTHVMERLPLDRYNGCSLEFPHEQNWFLIKADKNLGKHYAAWQRKYGNPETFGDPRHPASLAHSLECGADVGGDAEVYEKLYAHPRDARIRELKTDEIKRPIGSSPELLVPGYEDCQIEFCWNLAGQEWYEVRRKNHVIAIFRKFSNV